jgi:hypothetical protein
VVVDRGGTGSAVCIHARGYRRRPFRDNRAAADAVSDDDSRVASVVVLNDIAVPAALGRRLARFVEAGGGL